MIPCNALRAVAAQAGLAKSTKQRIRGSPPRCNKHVFQHKEGGTINQVRRGQTVHLHVWILCSQVSLLYIQQKAEKYLKIALRNLNS